MYLLYRFLTKILTGVALGFVSLIAVALGGATQPTYSLNACNISMYLEQNNLIQAAFRQHIWDASGKLVDTNRGHVVIARPYRFRWVPDQPEHPMIIANRKHVWIYDRDMAQAVRKPVSILQSDNPAALLSGSTATLHRHFVLKKCKREKDGRLWFFLRPKQNQALIKSLTLVFKDNALVMMRLIDQLDNKSQFDFSNLKKMTVLPESLFQFAPPDGVDVLASSLDNN